MIVASGIDWTQVLVALIAGLPAILAAIFAGLIHAQIKTPSKRPIGKQVEDVLHTALANNYHLQSIAPAVNAPTTPESQAVQAQVPGPPEVTGP